MSKAKGKQGFEITGHTLTQAARGAIRKAVGKSGDAEKLIDDTEERLRILGSSRRLPLQKYEPLHKQAASLRRHVESMSPEARRWLNHALCSHVELLDHLRNIEPEISDKKWLRTVDFVKNFEFACKSAESVQRSKVDLYGASIVKHLAGLWTEHTTRKASPSPDSPFVAFVAAVLSACTDYAGTDPRRLIERALTLS